MEYNTQIYVNQQHFKVSQVMKLYTLKIPCYHNTTKHNLVRFQINSQKTLTVELSYKVIRLLLFSYMVDWPREKSKMADDMMSYDVMWRHYQQNYVILKSKIKAFYLIYVISDE